METLIREIKLKNKRNPLRIVPVGDIHYGNKNCNVTQLKRTLHYIEETEDCYMIGMGDYVEAILAQDHRFEMGNHTIEVQNQVAEVIKWFKPLAEKGKILGLLTGNHEEKVRNTTSWNMTNLMCTTLGVPYLGYSAFIRLSVPHNQIHGYPFTLYVSHGVTSAGKAGSTLNRLTTMGEKFNADIYMMGHTHKLLAYPQVRLGINKKNLTKQIQYFINTGSFLETYAEGTMSYAEKAQYAPLETGTIELQLYPVNGFVSTRKLTGAEF